jgi:hypothetical protein
VIIMASSGDLNINLNEDSEDEFDWEEVEVPEKQDLEITIQTSGSRRKTDTINKSVSFVTLWLYLPDHFSGRKVYPTQSGS